MRSFTLQGNQTNQVVEALARVQFFSQLDGEALTKVAVNGRMAQFSDREVVLKAGDVADDFYVILSGEASVHVSTEDGAPIEVARLGKHDCIGEMGLIRGAKRSATVMSRGDLLTIAFNRQSFHRMFQLVPGFGLAICQALATRVHQTSSRLPTLTRDLAPPDPDTVGLLPTGFIQRHRALPLRQDGNKLTVGFVDEPREQTLAGLAELLPSFELRKVRISAAFFDSVLSSQAAIQGWSEGDEQANKPEKPAKTAASKQSGSSPKLDAILSRMVEEGASDLHISAGHRPRWRIDGEIRELSDIPQLGEDTVFKLIAPVLRDVDREQFVQTNDLDFAYAIRGVARFRGSMFRDHHGVGAVFRVIPDTILTAEQLGLPPIVTSLCNNPKGLIVVTGPTGSGKSTTLAAMLDMINKTRAEHVITFEDPSSSCTRAASACSTSARSAATP